MFAPPFGTGFWSLGTSVSLLLFLAPPPSSFSCCSFRECLRPSACANNFRLCSSALAFLCCCSFDVVQPSRFFVASIKMVSVGLRDVCLVGFCECCSLLHDACFCYRLAYSFVLGGLDVFFFLVCFASSLCPPSLFDPASPFLCSSLDLAHGPPSCPCVHVVVCLRAVPAAFWT